MNHFKSFLHRKLLCLILVGLLVGTFIGFIDVSDVFGQPSLTLKWRRSAGTSNTWLGPLVADLNNDGLMEIVLTGQNGVAALDSSGNVMWSAPYGGGHCPFEIIDLNKDGIPEILLNIETINGSGASGVVALHGNNGSLYWYNPNAAGDGNYMAVADINADGYPEIFCAIPGRMTALTYDGQIFASAYTYYTCWGGMTIGDTDFDGVFEVYLGERSDTYPSPGSGGRGLRALWADNLTEIWSHPDILCSSQAPVLADVDKDGDLEIIILHQRRGIAVINTDGSVNTYNGIYRKQLTISGLSSPGHTNPTIADVDGDGNLELIHCGDSSQNRYPPVIWDLVDWKLDATLPFSSIDPPGVVDIDGDGKLEIIAPNDQNVTIFKYNQATTNYDIIYTIPLAMAHPQFIAQDIDGDGKLELVFNQYNSWVSVYDLDVPAPTPLPRSELSFYSQYRTRVPVYVPSPEEPPKISEISPNDGATNVSVALSELSFKLTDYQNDLMNYTVVTYPNVGSDSGINVSNGEITVPVSGLAQSAIYAWTVTATDGACTTTRTFTFTTEIGPTVDDVIFDSNFDMGNLINVTYQEGAPGYRYYTAAVRYTIGTDPSHAGIAARTNNDKHWWFYFSMENVAGKTVAVSIVNGTDADWATSDTAGNRWPQIEPVYSYDNITWYRVPTSGFTYNRAAKIFTINITIPVEYNKVWLAPLPPYNIARRDALFAEFASSPYLTVTSLGTTPGGQELKVATITDPAYADSGKFRSYVTAQQHSGETPSSWNAEGLIRFLLSDDPTAAAIRRSYIFRIIPIVSVDSVYQGISRYTPIRDGYQYDINRWWSVNPISNAPFEVRTIYNDIQAFNPHSFNDMHSTINTEANSAREALTYRYSTLTTPYTNFMDRIRDGGWPETWRAASTLSGGCFQSVRSRLGVTFSLSWENPHDELRTNPGVKLTENDWMTWGQGWAKGNYLYFGNATATLTVTTSGSGSVVKDPNYATYTYGTSVQLTAIADAGYTFSHWEGDLTGNNNPANITMTGNKAVTAVFIEGEYTLTIHVEGSGTVSRDNNGPYHYGDVVQLTAIPDLGWEFAGWSGDLTGTGNPANITMTQNMVITAHFTGRQYTIVASVNGVGGTIVPSGSIIISHGQNQTFILNPDVGYHVSDLIVDGFSVAPSLSYTFYAVDQNHTITAVFAPNEYTLTINIIGEGSVTKTPEKTFYVDGETVQLTANANSGWAFSGWSGDLSGLINPANITMDGNKIVTAVFIESEYTLTINVEGGGSVSRNDTGPYHYGSVVQLTAISEPNWEFFEWSGDYTGTANPATIVITGDMTITAHFAGQNYTITASVAGIGGTIQPLGAVIVASGQNQTFIITPDAGYHVSDVIIDGSSIEPTTSYTFYSVDNNHTITAVFAQNEYVLTINVIGDGSVAKSPDNPLYTHGEIVELNATANSGWIFSGWSGDLTGTDNLADITMIQNMTITAHFTLKQYVISASVTGIGGTIEPSGTVTVFHGENSTFTITPNIGYHVLDVLVDGESQGATSTYTFYIVDMNHTITAIFAPNEYTLTVNVSPDGSGAVTLNNTGPYYYGDAVQLTAEPNTSWYFSQWEGDLLGSQNPAIIIIDGDKSITAVFTQELFTLNITIIGEGSVIKEPEKTIYTSGETVLLTAIAESGWTFSGWSGDLSGLANPANITMNGNKAVTVTFTPNNWWNLDWQYCRKITIDYTKVSGTLTDFPVLIEILDSSLIGKTQPNGYDFVFTDANNVKLDHQIEFYDSANGHLIAWVRVPILSSTADTILHMYYGNLASENQQNSTEVWDTNYMLALHLNENTGTLYDSTANGNNGTPFSGVLQGVTGKIDGADTFDGSNDYIDIPHSDTLAGYTEAFTVSFWIRVEDTNKRQAILSKYTTSGNLRSWQVEYDPLWWPNGQNPLWFFASQDGVTYREWWAEFTPAAGVWYHVTIVWEANSIPKFYINGVQVPTIGTGTISSIFNNAGAPLRIARSLYADRHFRGSLDEITISNQARSADWILTTYSNQFNPAAFYSLGTEETFQP